MDSLHYWTVSIELGSLLHQKGNQCNPVERQWIHRLDPRVCANEKFSNRLLDHLLNIDL
jgi:hypothetical protein